MFDPNKIDLNIDTSKPLPRTEREERAFKGMMKNLQEKLGPETIIDALCKHIEGQPEERRNYLLANEEIKEMYEEWQREQDWK